MKTHLGKGILVCVAALTAAGCSGGGSGSYGGNDGGGTGTQPPPAVGTAAFVPFVREQFAATSDSTDAVEVNDREWTFDEDEAAYSDML